MIALAPYHPKHASRPDLGVISSEVEYLATFRLLLLDTDLGRLDVLRHVEPIGEFDELRSTAMELADNRRAHVIDLDQLIEIKAHLTRPKDKIVEAELHAIRDRLSSQA